MVSKIPLSSQVIVGGLNRLEQSAHFFYLPKEDGLTSKIELAIILQDHGVQKEYSSLRFESMAQFRSFINNVIKAYVFYGRVEGLIMPGNFRYKMTEILKFVESCFHSSPESLKK